MLFDNGIGPIRDLKWLDPTGELQASWKAQMGEQKITNRHRGIGPISCNFTPEGAVEYCKIINFRLLKYRIVSGQWQPPYRVGCSSDLKDYTSSEGTRWAVEVAFGYLGWKTPYTDSFPVWDVPRPWENTKGAQEWWEES